MDGIGCERSELQRFCFKNVSLRRYGSFHGLIELCYLDGCRKVAKNQTKLFHSQIHSKRQWQCSFFKILKIKAQFGCFTLLVEAFKQFTPQEYILF